MRPAGTPSVTTMTFATDSVPSSSSLGRMPFAKDQMEIDSEIDHLTKEYSKSTFSCISSSFASSLSLKVSPASGYITLEISEAVESLTTLLTSLKIAKTAVYDFMTNECVLSIKKAHSEFKRN
ncbi:hypothetical protein G6F46_009976 [Rhizopus delemar]|nr:hypothetical protein G6F54_009597 [Rhizopus delemar]KAG1625984.1 hypothetical protein G6F45_008742 [Rhizopus arrhizus]KAG1503954.1 hypothetical protein G6F53_010507 [Rhizopus delemar]KAG1520856.1 hypothetical protein G6F52_007273 [Rhizopus delemar]KAG1548538.1 hypothetical protein G6F49_009870 [Rhizopus delemar]